MSAAGCEAVDLNTRLLKCGLEVENCRAYWAQVARRATGSNHPIQPREAFDEYWFGARSLGRVETLLRNLRARFDAFPPSLDVLGHWASMSPDTRRWICHWHLQLADPLYRAFTGRYLVERRTDGHNHVGHGLVVAWITRNGPAKWSMTTRVELAGRLLSAAKAAGLVASRRDPRPLVAPAVPGEAIEYLLHLLRNVSFQGSLLDNPYLASTGLAGPALEERLRSLPGMEFRRQGSLLDFGWRFPDLRAWARSYRSPELKPLVEVRA